jgi:hypothetical protein
MKIRSWLFAIALFIALPAAATAQCWICSSSQITPCEPGESGFNNCAQTSPTDCETNGGPCTWFAMNQIAPSGSLSLDSSSRAFALSMIEGADQPLRRPCDGAIIARSYSKDEKDVFLKRSSRLGF